MTDAPPPSPSPPSRSFSLFRLYPLVFFAFVMVVIVPRFFAGMKATQGGVAAYAALIDAANNRTIDDVKALCSRGYLATHRVEPAKEGGIVGLPRNIHPNFQAWQEPDGVLVCPTNREGPVYRFVLEADSYKFDGPVGLLKGGQLVREESDAAPGPATK